MAEGPLGSAQREAESPAVDLQAQVRREAELQAAEQ